MQALLVLVFAAGLVLFGMSRFDFSPDEINSTVNKVLEEQTQTKQVEKITAQAKSDETAVKAQTTQLISQKQADDYSKMNEPVAPSVEMIMQGQIQEQSPEQSIVVGEQSTTQEVAENSSSSQVVAYRQEYQNKHSIDDVFQVNQNTDELLQQYDSLKNQY